MIYICIRLLGLFQVLGEERFYETLDDLLSATSPAYAEKRVETLIARLQGVVDTKEGS
jgi:hypothetical protein